MARQRERDGVNLKIDLLEKDLALFQKKHGFDSAFLSKTLLEKGPTYIRTSLYNGRMSQKKLEKLAEFMGKDYSIYISEELEACPRGSHKCGAVDRAEAEPKQLDKVETESKQTSIDNLIVGLNSMYNLHNNILSEIKSQNELTRQLLQEIKCLKQTVNNINSTATTGTEKIKAIFTEVKYNR